MGWIQTYSGKRFTPFSPSSEDVCIKDIAHALSNICRFTGHTIRFYSVAEHCCHMFDRSFYLNDDTRMLVLLHDAAEAYIRDISRPLKSSLQVGTGWDNIPVVRKEKEIFLCILEALSPRRWTEFEVEEIMKTIVSGLDDTMLATEADRVFGGGGRLSGWQPLPEPFVDLDIGFWLPERAEVEFLERWESIPWTGR